MNLLLAKKINSPPNKMKNIRKFRKIAIAFCFILFSNMIQSQNSYKISSSKNSEIKVSGTSTLHEWVMNTKTFSCEAQFEIIPGIINQLQSILSLSFSLPIQNLKSGKKKMDKNAYKALNEDQYSAIVFKLVSANVFPQKDDKYKMDIHGNLSIAGITKSIDMEVYCKINSDRSITCSGSKKLRMTEYKVQPPVFMSGAMKTGDEITVDFVLFFIK